MSHYRPYPAYRRSGIPLLGDIPTEWAVKPLKRLAKVELSNVDKLTVEGQTPVRLCNYVDVYKNERIVSTLPFMEASASSDQIRRLTLKQGDVLITKDSETPDDIGIPALVDESMDGVVCGYHLALLRPERRHAIGGYVYRVLQSTYVKAEFFCSALGLTRYGLSKHDIESLKLPAPPLAEQSQITAVLDRETARIDALIAKKTEFINLLAKKQQALIAHAVTKGLNPKAKARDSGVEWIGEVPEHWSVAPIKRWFSTTSGATPDTSQQAKYYALTDGIPWIRTTDLTNGPIDDFEIGITEQALSDTACNLLPRKSVLLAMYGGEGTIGKNGILEIRACINQAICALLPNPHFVPEFTFAYVQFYRPHWMIDAASTRKDPNINQEVIRNAPIVRPPEDEQLQIVSLLKNALGRMDALAAKTQHSIDLLRQRRSALITAAVTGQIDLRKSA